MRRVVVTGLGAVSPCGVGAGASWTAAVEGRSGIGPLTRFDASDWGVRIAGQADDFDPDTVMDRREQRRHDRFSQLAMAAALEAAAHAGFADGFGHDDALAERAGVYVGSGIGGIGEIEGGSVDVHERGPRRVSPFFIPRSLGNLATGQIAMRLQARGPSLCVSTACATGNHSIGEAFRAIRLGDADVVLAGGAEAPITPVSVAGFLVMRALSKHNDDPAAASRPFDRDRDGFVMGEGAGVLVLESRAHAAARGAAPLFVVAGCGASADAHHATAPPEDGAGAVLAMRRAIEDAGLSPADIGHHNAHGTSTPLNDAAEARALHAVFGSDVDRLAVTSTKGVTGHLLGAAGAVEAILAAMALREGRVPPTANLATQDPDIHLDVVAGAPREVGLRAVISASMGFGGQNAALVLTAA